LANLQLLLVEVDVTLHLVVVDWHTSIPHHTLNLLRVGIGDADGPGQAHVVHFFHPTPHLLQLLLVVQAGQVGLRMGWNGIEWMIEFGRYYEE
jgi:hypothetical protein